MPGLHPYAPYLPVPFKKRRQPVFVQRYRPSVKGYKFGKTELAKLVSSHILFSPKECGPMK